MTPDQIAARLGLHRAGRGWRGDCPACGYRDAFALRPGRGDRIGLFCASCGDRAGITAAVRMAVGGDWTPPVSAAPADDAAVRARRQEAAARLWRGAVPAAGTPAAAYLTGRALPGLVASEALRFRADTPHPEGGKLPALLALVQDAAGAPIAIHRTFLRPDGSGKALVEPAKATLGPVWGGAIRLHPPAAELLVGEGIETSASAGLLLGLPAWAAVSAGNLARGLVLPVEVRAVVVAADADAPGEAAARTAALRWQAEGRGVRVIRPDQAGTDFNDVLKSRPGAAEVAHVA